MHPPLPHTSPEITLVASVGYPSSPHYNLALQRPCETRANSSPSWAKQEEAKAKWTQRSSPVALLLCANEVVGHLGREETTQQVERGEWREGAWRVWSGVMSSMECKLVKCSVWHVVCVCVIVCVTVFVFHVYMLIHSFKNCIRVCGCQVVFLWFLGLCLM